MSGMAFFMAVVSTRDDVTGVSSLSCCDVIVHYATYIVYWQCAQSCYVYFVQYVHRYVYECVL